MWIVQAKKVSTTILEDVKIQNWIHLALRRERSLWNSILNQTLQDKNPRNRDKEGLTTKSSSMKVRIWSVKIRKVFNTFSWEKLYSKTTKGMAYSTQKRELSRKRQSSKYIRKGNNNLQNNGKGFLKEAYNLDWV